MNIALVLSGGKGVRIGGDIPKQYIKVNGRMILSYSLETLITDAMIDGLDIVANDEYVKQIKEEIAIICKEHDYEFLLEESVIKRYEFLEPDAKEKSYISSISIIFSTPGDTRQMSIVSGLRDINRNYPEVDDEELVVMIHDGARPNLSSRTITSSILAIYGHDGVMPALPMKDTVYLTENGKTVAGLIDRKTVLAGQAPETYKLRPYLAACEQLIPDKIGSINGTTEPAIMAGLDVVIIPGDENNYKITTQRDLDRFIECQNKL